MNQIQLSVEESLAFAQQSSFWDGFSAGAKAAADHAKQMAVQQILSARKPAQPTPEVPNVPAE